MSGGFIVMGWGTLYPAELRVLGLLQHYQDDRLDSNQRPPPSHDRITLAFERKASTVLRMFIRRPLMQRPQSVFRPRWRAQIRTTQTTRT